MSITEKIWAPAVVLRTSGGVDGWGETTPISQVTGDTQAINAAAAHDLARLLLGADALDIEGRVADMARFLAFNSSVRAALVALRRDGMEKTPSFSVS